MRKDGEEELILKDAVLVEPCEEGTRIQGFFEPPSTVKARLVTVDLLNHKIILEPED
jgi:predicted RNA-binding protein